MASQLLVNVLSIGPLGAGASTTVAHGLKSGDVGVVPTQVICDRTSPIQVTATTTSTITFTNLDVTNPASAVFRAEYDHSIHATGATPVNWQGYVPTYAPAGEAVWAQFSDSTDQNLSGTPLDLKFNTKDGGVVGVTVANDPVTGRASRLTVSAAGVYAFTISPQLQHFGGGGAELINFYAVTNGGTVPNSASYTDLANNNRATLPYLELLLPMAAGDWVQWWMAGSPGTSIRVNARPAAPPIPAAPSVIAGVKLIGS